MQKKNYSEDSSSSWEQNLRKQERADAFKKYGIWVGIIVASIAGLAGLVILAGQTNTSSQQTAVEVANLPKPKPTDIVEGDQKAKVVITEYADFQCPACAANNPLTNQILEEYKGKVKLVYRFLPLRGIHKNALISGQAAYAGWRLGKFGELKDMLYENQASWENLSDPAQTFIGYAKEAGLDESQFQTLMRSDEAKNAVLDGEKEALSLGLNSTPTFFIGNKKVQLQGYDGFKKLIDEELAPKK